MNVSIDTKKKIIVLLDETPLTDLLDLLADLKLDLKIYKIVSKEPEKIIVKEYIYNSPTIYPYIPSNPWTTYPVYCGTAEKTVYPSFTTNTGVTSASCGSTGKDYNPTATMNTENSVHTDIHNTLNDIFQSAFK